MLREQFPNTVPLNNMLVAGLVEHIPSLPGAPSFQQYHALKQELAEAVA